MSSSLWNAALNSLVIESKGIEKVDEKEMVPILEKFAGANMTPSNATITTIASIILTKMLEGNDASVANYTRACYLAGLAPKGIVSYHFLKISSALSRERRSILADRVSKYIA